MHLQVGDDLHGVVRGGQVVLVPCHCHPGPCILPEIRLPAFAASFYPVTIPTERKS
jgi:hypothetical protein